MLEDYISPGDRIELQTVQGGWNPTEKEDNRIYSSKIADIVSEDRLDMMMPMEKGKLILLPVDGEYNVFIYSKRGQFQCFGKIADRYRTNNMYMLTMDLLSGLQRMQRRAYYRFPCAFEMQCRELTDYEQLAMSSNAFFEPNLGDSLQKGVIVDISGGGIRFVSVNRFEEGMTLYTIFKLPSRKSTEEYRVCIRVLKARELENRPDTFEYRAQYTIIDEDDREDIIHYIFEEERKIRKKQEN
ncbi:MAG: flagellar brake protein [Lachnospiraceae bacterium]|nr:flagellar brake protein [Lachnospiraceae bacterium]MBR0090139.1 flagellar brake protein [Lachnospiraceae bacterium]MBR5970117.1 flagellar brake protein [Lachnospiraceae bacterium]